MTKTRSTKSALISSVIALLLCFTMLLGSTFAWFTDSVTSANNIIKAGNLDIELEYAKVVDGNITEWDTVSGKDNIFDKNALWEPGRVEVVYLKVSNLGTLALKYQLGVNVVNEVTGTNVAGQEFKLSDHLVFKAVEMPDALTTYTDREAVAVAAGTEKGLKDYNGRTTALDAKGGENDVDYVALIVYMPESVGNEANYRGDKIPTITLGVNLYATQYTAESDSFNDQYDKDAWVTGMKVYNASDLQTAINAGETDIVLMDDITLDESIVIPASATTFSTISATPATVIDLNGKTISNANGYAIVNYGNLVMMGEGTVSGLGAINSVGGALEINGGTYTGSSDYASNQWEHVLRVAESTATINGGTFDASIGNLTNAMINVSDNGTLIINGGVFNGTINKHNNAPTYLFTYKPGGSLTINDGTFTGGWRFNEKATTNIYGGTFDVSHDGQSFQLNNDHELKVYGGIFANKLADSIKTCVADGYKALTTGGKCYVVSNDIDAVVSTNEELQAAVNACQEEIILTDGEFTVDLYSITARDSMIITGQGAATKLNFKNQQVRLSQFDKSLTINNLEIGRMVNKSWGQLVFGSSDNAGGVYTISDCIFNGVGTQGIYINQNVDATVNVENCIFNGDFSKDGAITIQNNDAVFTVNVNDCEFNNIPETSHDIFAAPNNTQDGTWTLLVDGKVTVATAKQLANAVAKGETNINLLDGEYDVYGCGGKTLTLNGSKKAVLVVKGTGAGENGGQSDYGFGEAGTGDGHITFNGLTIRTNGNTYAGYTYMVGTYNDCVIENTYCLYRDSEFYNCTFNVSGDRYNLWTWGAKNLKLEDCTFNCDGKAVLVYNGTTNCNLTVIDCIFNDNGTISGKAAIEIGDDYKNGNVNLTVTGVAAGTTVVNGFDINPNGTNTNSTIWANKNSMTDDKLNITIDGVDIY